jgi:hypothetical protein
MRQDGTRAMTLRLKPVQSVRLQAVARVLGLSVNATIRTALDHYFDFVKRDDRFQRQLHATLADQQCALVSLLDREDGGPGNERE